MSLFNIVASIVGFIAFALAINISFMRADKRRSSEQATEAVLAEQNGLTQINSIIAQMESKYGFEISDEIAEKLFHEYGLINGKSDAFTIIPRGLFKTTYRAYWDPKTDELTLKSKIDGGFKFTEHRHNDPTVTIKNITKGKR